MLGARVFIEGMKLSGKLDDLHPHGFTPPFIKKDILVVALEPNEAINIAEQWTTYDEWVVKYMKETGEILPIATIIQKMKERIPKPLGLYDGYDNYFCFLVRDNGPISAKGAIHIWQILINKTP